MRVIVTGGAGYVGSAVVEALLDAGHDVAVFDSLAKGHPQSLAGLPVRLIAGDLSLRDEIDAALRDSAAEAVIHTAGSIEAGESMKDPGKYYRDNVVNSINLLDSMVANGVERFVFSSSAGVYGNPVRVPIEEDDPTSPENCYGETKLVVERAAAWYGRVGLKSVFLRYFNAAGATERLGEAHHPETHVIPLCLQVALGRRDHFSIFGTDYPTPDGTAIRDYVHLADLARAHLLALGLPFAAGERPGRAFNLGNGSGFSVREVVEVSRKVTGHPIPVQELARRPGDPAVLVADARRAAEVLGWTPRYRDLEAIIRSAWEWHRRNPNGYTVNS
ncbi:MAG TPA: UDP-glucose 4-epimerase GalE [Chloroflexota bacterium]|nr:UDP-glucose 4-epimerase GalE [Chloroflexota bacterium]